MAVGKESCLTPPVQSFALLVVEQGDNASFVVDVGLLANKGSLHLVNGLLEKFLILPDQQLLYALQTAFALAD